MLGAMINGWLALATTALATVSPAAPAGPPTAGAPAPTLAELPEILTAVRSPGARAVLVNVWATWCDPCRQEMPELIRFYRDHREDGLRLVLVSADDEENRAQVAQVLAEAGLPADTLSFIKRGDDMKFIDGLDRHWSGALPASFLFDGRGRKRRTWLGPVTYHSLELGAGRLLTAPVTPAPQPGRRRP
jgi:thiol-disulfide isomerase/thioredoxin